MAAEGGRTALADRLKRFFLMGSEHRSPSLEEIAFVFAEDIGHFEPMFPHDCREEVRAGWTRLSESSSSSGLLAERIVLSAT